MELKFIAINLPSALHWTWLPCKQVKAFFNKLNFGSQVVVFDASYLSARKRSHQHVYRKY